MHDTLFIGLSGGVDSAVSAALLKRAGYRCVGVFFESWSNESGPSQCQQADDRRDAARVAAHLDIPFLILPCAEQYRARVLEYFLAEVALGRTPNPDIRCNEEIKFRLFLDTSLRAGATRIATGHYARLQTVAGATAPRLLKGVDREKDQSYFLSRVPPAQFRHVLFPVGGMTKSRVRQLAREFRLPNAAKPDSQGLCFVGKISLPRFVDHFLAPRPGPIITTNGETVGQHEGLTHYTVGQRHGFRTAVGVPHYVVAKDLEKNALLISSEPERHRRNAVTVSDWRWHVPSRPTGILTAKLRYRQADQQIRSIRGGGTEVVVDFQSPQDPVAAGQIMAIYDDQALVASGVVL